MENQEIVTINGANALEVINRSEVEMQISTAKKFPRNLDAIINDVKMLAAHDPETAASCYYNVDGIEGLSVRFAEILAYSWGNLRVATRIVGQDQKTITAQAVCFDLEKNLAVSTEVQASILNKKGERFHDRLIVTTGKAAAAKAFRDAVYKVIPRASLKVVLDEVKAVAAKQVASLSDMRAALVNWFAHRGVQCKDLLEYVGVSNIEELTPEQCLQLKGVSIAINDGEVTAEAAILDVLRERRRAAEAEKKATSNQDKVAQAMAK